MLISLVVIRLEIAEISHIPARFTPYSAPSFNHPVTRGKEAQHRPSYAHITRQAAVSSKEQSPPKSQDPRARENSTECRGSRPYEDIGLQFLSGKEIQAMEKEEENGREGHNNSKSSAPETHREGSGKESKDMASFRKMKRNVSREKEEECDGPGPTPGTPGKQQKSRSPAGHHSDSVAFITGNPCVEVVNGILHLYKDSQMTSLEEGVERSEMLCMMAIPAAYTIHDLIKFTAPLNESMESMQVLKGAMRNQYMLLIKFKDQSSADEFYQYFNGRPFNSIEENMCHLVYVARVEIIKESEGGSLSVPGLTELPHCPVCLERMEESVDGVLTVLCNHSFHMTCLAQWGDTTCPVCRYCQTPEQVPDQRCMRCGSEDSLWICLICGSVGCGRYVGLHAYKHFQETNHTYAMQLGTNRVWDYAGDNYVHRLAQNKSDGKLVQLDEADTSYHEEKVDSITLEYTYLLTTQLESQRRYFEERIVEETKAAALRVQEVEEQLGALTEEKSRVSARLSETTREKQALDKKCSQMHTRLGRVLGELQEEREMNKCLTDNQHIWQERVAKLEASVQDLGLSKEEEINDLREQLRDVMFYLEAQQKLATTSDVTQEEIQDGQVIVGAAAPPDSKKRGKKRR